MSVPVSPAAAWGDAAVIVPWVLYQRYGDAGILARQFDSIRRGSTCSPAWPAGAVMGTRHAVRRLA